MSDLGNELESFIEAITPTIKSSIQLIELDDWADVEEFDERVNLYNLQQLITKRNLEHALKIQNLAQQNNCTDDERVVEMLGILTGTFNIYRERYSRYFDSQRDRVESLIQNRKKNKEEGVESKKKAKGKLTSDADEIKFQSDMSEHMKKLLIIFKNISDLGDSKSVNIATYNNTPIPLAMRDLVVKSFPNVGDYLEKL